MTLEVGHSKMASKKPGEWLQMEVDCNGSQVRVVLNGEKIVDVDLAKTESLENHPGRKRTRGPHPPQLDALAPHAHLTLVLRD